LQAGGVAPPAAAFVPQSAAPPDKVFRAKDGIIKSAGIFFPSCICLTHPEPAGILFFRGAGS